VIVPKLAGPSWAAGAPKFAVFTRLNASSRKLDRALTSDAHATHEREIDIVV
jgi:hypothetical protein